MQGDSRKLLEQTAGGDAVALEELVRRHLPGLRAFIRLRMGPELREKESCSDVAQSVCVELLRKLDDFEYRGEGRFKSWLYTVALHKISEHLRYHKLRGGDGGMAPGPRADSRFEQLREGYASLHTPSRNAAAREQLELVEAAFDRMPEEYREVITLTKIVGLSGAEVAQHMGRSEGATRMLLHRALARLSTLLETRE